MIVSFAILARVVAQKDMGVLAALVLVIDLCTMVAGLSLRDAVIRFGAEKLSHDEEHAASAIFYQAARATVTLASVLALLVSLGAGFFSVQLFGEPTYTLFFWVLAPDIVLQAGLLPSLTGAMAGLQKFKEISVVGVVTALIRQSLIVLLVIALHDFLGLVIAWVIADFIAVSIYSRYVLRAFGRPAFDFPLRLLLKFSLPLFLGQIVSFLCTWFDRILLLAFVPLTVLGVYNVAMFAFNFLLGISGAIVTTLLPTYSTMQSPHQHRLLSQTVRRASRYVSFVGIPLALGLAATSKPALTLLVGETYAQAAGPLMVLSTALALTLVGTLLDPILLALGQTRVSFAITLASLVTSLVSGLVLLPTFGMMGASFARAIAMILSTGLVVLVVTRRTEVELDIGAIARSSIAGIVMAAIVLAAQILLYSKLLLPFYALLGAIVYLVMLRLLKAVQKEDIDLMDDYVGPRLAFASSLLRKILL